MKNLDIVFFDAGSGHRSAAVALQKVLSGLYPHWNVRAINIVDIFEIILTGYFLATYLAIARNVDPYKTPFIAEFKHHMSS